LPIMVAPLVKTLFSQIQHYYKIGSTNGPRWIGRGQRSEKLPGGGRLREGTRRESVALGAIVRLRSVVLRPNLPPSEALCFRLRRIACVQRSGDRLANDSGPSGRMMCCSTARVLWHSPR
jgi:hypothetical protein